MAEYTAWTDSDPAPAPQVSYLTEDHLGSPRVATNQNGEVIKRTDWMAFGEEIEFNKRTSGLGYDEVPETGKGYTVYEKDEESGHHALPGEILQPEARPLHVRRSADRERERQKMSKKRPPSRAATS